MNREEEEEERRERGIAAREIMRHTCDIKPFFVMRETIYI